MNPLPSLSLVGGWVLSVREQALLWVIHLGTVVFMTGLIWLIQGVQYPLMALVGLEPFPRFHEAHSVRITWIVLPIMLLQLLTAGLLVFQLWRFPVWASAGSVCLALSAAVFIATAFLSVPEHQILARGFDALAHQRLVQTNWVRTATWSLHALWMLWLTFRALGGAVKTPT